MIFMIFTDGPTYKICRSILLGPNLLSYCGLTDVRMRASEKDLPVKVNLCQKLFFLQNMFFSGFELGIFMY